VLQTIQNVPSKVFQGVAIFAHPRVVFSLPLKHVVASVVLAQLALLVQQQITTIAVLLTRILQHIRIVMIGADNES
jgi:hypothetical protein